MSKPNREFTPGICKHCGAAHDVKTKAGAPGTVCKPCRENQRGIDDRPARKPRTLSSAAPRTRSEAIERAHHLAQTTGIPLLAALKAEGVI